MQMRAAIFSDIGLTAFLGSNAGIGYIDVGDGRWRQKLLVTTLGCR